MQHYARSRMNSHNHLVRQILHALVVITLFAATNLLAQSNQKFTGHVTDLSGATIVDASVTITNEGTGVVNVLHTTEAGDYALTNVRPGPYSITVSKSGFQTLTKNHINLDVDQSSNIDFQLKVGAVSETLTVNAEAVQLNVSKSDRGEVIDNLRIEEMPVDTANPQKLFNLSAGTLDKNQAQFPRPFDNVNKNDYANGTNAIAAQNLDGMTNDNQNGYVGFIPSNESIQEFRVVTNPYDASYGRNGGAAVDMQLKTGTNKIHGVGYEYMRRKILDANNWNNNYSGIQRPDHRREQYGFELDGPVVLPKLYHGRDKTFFLIQLEQIFDTLPNATSAINSVPPAAWLTGDFSSATYYNTKTKSLLPLTIYDPESPLTTYTDPVSGETGQAHSAFPGNKIPTVRLNPVGLTLASYYAAVEAQTVPNTGAAAPYTNNLNWLPIEYDDWHSALIKLDHNLSNNDRITARWDWQQRFAKTNQTGIPASDPAAAVSHQDQPKSQGGFLEEVHTFNANTVLDNKVTVMTTVNATWQGQELPNAMANIGFSSHLLSNVAYLNAFPQVNTNGFLQFGPSSSGAGNIRNAHTLGYAPNLTYIKGKQTIRAGLDMRLQQYAVPGGAVGNNLTFKDDWSQEFYNGTTPSGYQTGSPVADMLLGDLDSGTVYTVPFEPLYSQHYYALWVQDDYKVTPRLTLNIGLRWDVLGARTERHNKLDYTFNTSVLNTVANAQIQATNPTVNPNPIQFPTAVAPSTGFVSAYSGGLEFVGVNGNPRGEYATQYGNFQPTIGAAYSINNKTSIRGGFRTLYFNNENTDSNTGFTGSTSYLNTINQINPYGGEPGGSFPNGALADPFPTFSPASGSSLGYLTNLGNTFSFINPYYHLPRLMSYSVTLQRLLGSRDTLDVSYSGNQASGLDSSININPPSAAFQATCDPERGGFRENCDSTNAATVYPTTGLSGYYGLVPNPFHNVLAFSGSSYYTATTMTKLNMTRPFPMFGDITENSANILHSWYNSFQANYGHQFKYDVSFHAAYTFSKTMQSGNQIDAINRIYGRNISGNDVPNIISLSGVYTLPVGRGHLLLGNANRIVDGIIGGWQAAHIYNYVQGYPWSLGTNWSIKSPIAVHQHNIAPGSVALPATYTRLNAVSPCIGYVNQDSGEIVLEPIAIAEGCATAKAVMDPPNYAVAKNVVYSGVRIPSEHQFDVSLSKSFDVYERMKLHVRVDALNVLNHPIWQDNYVTTATSLDFGSIREGGGDSTTSVARQIQLSAKLTF